jgi:hypothetical protein
MLRLLAVAAVASAAPRNDGKSDEKLSHEAQTYYDPAAQTFALYTLLGVPTNATLAEIDQAYVKKKNLLERRQGKDWFQSHNGEIYALIYKSLDEDEDGLLSSEESESLVEALGLRLDEEDDHVQESVAKFRRRTCTSSDAVFSSKEHLMIVATYASLRTARVTLGDAEMRTKYDEQERVKAREYAEDVDDDNTYLGAAKRKIFGIIYYGIYGGIVAWTIVAVVACLAYVACKALSSIPNAPPLFGRCADRCGSVLIWINPGWSTVCTLAFCAPSTVLAAVLSCVEINQCVGCTRQFFTKSFLGDDAAVLARSSGEEPALPHHLAGVASMAWRTTR